ncbi:MAG: hypothetical protein KDD47_19640, partial [Acidobacteria bacterium]|nr:hypothetical protein [Acidobacteriota bacterium]
MPDWDEASPRLRANLNQLLRRILDEARRREMPTAKLLCSWHEEMLAGLEVPHPDFAGQFRGDPSSEALRSCRVRVGTVPGVPPDEVAEEVQTFEIRLRKALGLLDEEIPEGDSPGEETL